MFDVLRGLGPVDVQVGAIQGFNQFSNGLRDPVDYIERIRPGLFVPSHHDDRAAGITTRGEHYREPFFSELATVAAPPEVRFITDPGDYIAPMAFPAPLRPLRPTCRGRLRGDRADVRRVVRRERGATVVFFDGTRQRLKRRC